MSKQRKPPKCQDCKEAAVGYWLWADGRASAHACAKHKMAVKKRLKKDNGKWAAIVGWRPLEKKAALYKNAAYEEVIPDDLRKVEALQSTPHRRMTPQEKTRLRQQLKRHPQGQKKRLMSFSQPQWRAISGKMHKGCWQVTFSYQIQGGAGRGKTSNFTRCVGYDKASKPSVKKNSANKGGYEIVKPKKLKIVRKKEATWKGTTMGSKSRSSIQYKGATYLEVVALKGDVVKKVHPNETPHGREFYIKPPNGSRVRPNPDYNAKTDNTYYCKSLSKGKEDVPKNWVRHYTKDFVKRNQGDLFKDLPKFHKSLPKVQARYQKDMKSSDKTRRYLGLTLAIIDKVWMRIGNDKAANREDKDKRTYGLTTLRASNVKVKGKDILFSFPGKAGVQQNHKLKNEPLIAKLCTELLKNKKPSDYFLQYKAAGKVKRITDAVANAYFKGSGGAASVHKFRHHHASEAAAEAAKQEVPEQAQQSAKTLFKYWKGKMAPISSKLGHTSAKTTLKHYVDPKITKEFFKKHGFNVPEGVLASWKGPEGLKTMLSKFVRIPFEKTAAPV